MTTAQRISFFEGLTSPDESHWTWYNQLLDVDLTKGYYFKILAKYPNVQNVHDYRTAAKDWYATCNAQHNTQGVYPWKLT